jgi:hypothetical protein
MVPTLQSHLGRRSTDVAGPGRHCWACPGKIARLPPARRWCCPPGQRAGGPRAPQCRPPGSLATSGAVLHKCREFFTRHSVSPVFFSSRTVSLHRCLIAVFRRLCATTHDTTISDAHESSILAAQSLGLASIFLPRNRLATLERASTVLEYTRPFTPLVFRCATVLDTTRRHSPPLASAQPSPTTLDSTRPRLAHSCASLTTILLLRALISLGNAI